MRTGIETARGRDWPFYLSFGILGGSYVVLIVLALGAQLLHTSPGSVGAALASPAIQHSIFLSLVTCSISTILALWVAVPLGYLLARTRFPGRTLVELILDIPIALPPLVVGLCLLILFESSAGKALQELIPVTYAVPSIILAQFTVVAAFAVRTMRVTFEQIPARTESVAMTLGCSRSQAFWRVTFPQARRGLLSAATTCWARALGEFGPILVFSSTTRMKTEVLPTTVFLEMSVGRLNAAIAVSLVMIVAAVLVLGLTRLLGVNASSAGEAA